MFFNESLKFDTSAFNSILDILWSLFVSILFIARFICSLVGSSPPNSKNNFFKPLTNSFSSIKPLESASIPVKIKVVVWSIISGSFNNSRNSSISSWVKQKQIYYFLI